MAAPLVSRFGVRCCFIAKNPGLFSAAVCPAVVLQTRSKVTNKHYDPKWRRERGRKFMKIKLPDWQKIKREGNMAPDEMRAYQKKEKQLPARTQQERDIIISSTSAVFEPYVPPEGDGKASFISGKGAQQTIEQMGKKSKSYLQLRKIKQFEENFDSATFAQDAQDIYIEANNLLQNIEKNEDRLHELVTERAYPEMTWQLEKKSFRWKFIESIEPPRVVHVRQTDMLSKENVYGQITVRFHTKQTMAIYDRFGRLMFGGEKIHRDCLEYVVFEKHLSNIYGTWRIHGKVTPDWMPRSTPVIRTMRQPTFSEIEEIEDENKDEKKEEGQLATA